MDMKTTELGAAAELRKYLAGVKQTVGIECAFQALLMREVALIEHRSHQVAFFDADTVLTGQHAADLDAELQYIGSKSLGSLDLFGPIGIIQDERVKIAVAGMEHVGDGEPITV